VPYIASTRSSSPRSRTRREISKRDVETRFVNRYVELAIVRSLAHSEGASELLVDIANPRRNEIARLARERERERERERVSPFNTVDHRDVTRELASARISRRRALDATFTCQLSLRRLRYPYISLSGAVNRADFCEILRAKERERNREGERELAREYATPRRMSEREQGATVRVLPNPGKITA